MAARKDDEVWRQPKAVAGGEVRLGGKATVMPSSGAKARLRRIVARSPEVVVKVTGRTRNGPAHLKAHLDYITRNGTLVAQLQDGRTVSTRDELRDVHQDWVETNRRLARRRTPGAAESINVILSMRPGTSPATVEEAARSWARESFGEKHDWMIVRHNDSEHPHVHVAVRAVGTDGRRLAPGPEQLQEWRVRFARELRRYGVEAEATPRQARGVVPKASPLPEHHRRITGRPSIVRQREHDNATKEAVREKPSATPHWSWTIQRRQENIRAAYLNHATVLQQGDNDDRQLGRDIRRFVEDLPVALTRQQTLEVELRAVRSTIDAAGRVLPSSGAEPVREPGRDQPEPSRPRS